ncbi:MAG TPA: lipid-binding protein [Flavobacterium sp.]
MKIKHITTLFFITLCTMFTSCDEGGNPEGGGTTTRNFAGDWYITISDDSEVLGENIRHYTYNTAANDNTMWIDDHGAGYGIKCKMRIDLETGTFTAEGQPNLASTYNPNQPISPANDPIYADDTVTITEGKIEKGAGLSKSGHVVDKISFKAHFSYDTVDYTVTYIGHKRTGFLEDEY